ncbi:MAG: hypothetical protein H0T73_14835 [Ardenticatenales bacterium]|nr:hypothetical protein [Ardenticatenales bacterium]
MSNLILIVALLLALWAAWPPRGMRRRWLALALVVLWAAMVLAGGQRGVQPGFAPWLIVLSLIGALVALVVLWSLATVLGAPRGTEEKEQEP